MGPISYGVEQGAHALDPSGDGDQTRVGLAKAVDQRRLDATCNLIAYLMVGNAGR